MLQFIAGVSLIAVIGVIALFFVKSVGNEKTPDGFKLPPKYSTGTKYIGNMVGFAKHPINFIHKAKEEQGNLFTIDFVVEKLTFLIGSKYHKYFFESDDTQMDQADVYRFMTPIFGKSVIYDAPLIKRRQQYRALGSALKPANLRVYSEIIAKETIKYLKSKWGKEGQIDLLPSMAELIILTASATLLGDEIRGNMFLEVSKLYAMLDHGLTPISIFFPYLPIKAHGQRDKARKEMVKLFTKVIHKRRKEGIKKQDMLQKLMDFKYKDGKRLTEDEITGLLIATLFAGQHTSSITTSWSLLFLLNDKKKQGQQYSKVLSEIEQLETELKGDFANGVGVNFKLLQKEENLYCSIKEAIRMYPPLIFLMRRVQKSFTTDDGYFIPKGHRVMVSNAVAQRLNEIYEEPNEYKPDRWKSFNIAKLPKYSFIGFGAGIHTCMGESFAFMQIQTILTVMLSMYDMDLTTAFPKPNYEAIVVPPLGPNMIKYKLKQRGVTRESEREVVQPVGKNVTKQANFDDDTESLKNYSLEEIAKHDKIDDAWLVVNGFVYDVSNYVSLHQGGDNAILRFAGKPDATDAVFGPQHPKTVPTLLERFKIGKVAK